MRSEYLKPNYQELVVDPSFRLTPKILMAPPEYRDGCLRLVPKFVPINQVEVPWIVKAARSILPLTDLDAHPPATIFHYKQGIWVTNYHCLIPYFGSTVESQMPLAVIGTNPPLNLSGSEWQPKAFPGLDTSGTGDLLVIQAPASSTPPLSTPMRNIPRDVFTPSLVIGYPYGLPVENAPYVSYGGDSRLYDDDPPIHGHCWGLRTLHGNSGSPVFDVEGNIIGVFSGSFQSIHRVEALIAQLEGER